MIPNMNKNKAGAVEREFDGGVGAPVSDESRADAS